MKILITGGCGFIGTNLIKSIGEKWASDGGMEELEIHVLDNYSTGFKHNEVDDVHVTYHDFDVSDYFFDNRMNEVLGDWRPDTIYHLAALARIQPSFTEPKKTFAANTIGTQNILEWARVNGNIQVVYAGSSSSHGDIFANPYTFYKYNGELLVELYSKIYDLPTTICRFYNVYGEHMIPADNPYVAVVAIFDEQKLSNKPLSVTNDGDQRRDFTNVLDICSGLMACQGRTDLKAEYFELGSGKNYSINELVTMYESESVNIGPRPGEMRITLCTDTKAHEMLGWKPVHDLKDYITDKVKEANETAISEPA
jgi:UDP-glucose 4-epimerase